MVDQISGETKSLQNYFEKNNSRPDIKEIYFAKFMRSENLEKNKYVKKSLKKYVFSKILKKFKFNNFDIRCHTFLAGYFLKAYYHHYISKLTITINLNKKWKADWDGLLCLLNDKDNKINTLVPE